MLIGSVQAERLAASVVHSGLNVTPEVSSPKLQIFTLEKA